MNKKLLAMAVGAALAGSAVSANAGIKVFGAAQFEVYAETNTIEVEDGAGNTILDAETFQGQLTDAQRGRYGIKADEDLGGGLKGLAHIEYDTRGAGEDGGTGCGGLGCGSGERQIWAGLKGGFGMITGGSHHGIYKTFGGVKWDPLTATMLEARNSNAMSGGRFGHNNFIDRSIRYMSPKLGPVVIGVVRGVDYADVKNNADGVASENEVEGTGTDNSHLQIGAKAKFGPAEVIAVYGIQKQTKNAPGSDGTQVAGEDSVRFKVGGRFTFAKNHKVAVQIENIQDQGGVEAIEQHIYVNWVGKFGPIMPQVGIGSYAAEFEEDNAAPDTITDVGTFFHAAVAWKPTKTFRIFGGLRTQANIIEGEDNAGNSLGEATLTETIYSVGMRKDF